MGKSLTVCAPKCLKYSGCPDCSESALVKPCPYLVSGPPCPCWPGPGSCFSTCEVGDVALSMGNKIRLLVWSYMPKMRRIFVGTKVYCCWPTTVRKRSEERRVGKEGKCREWQAD